MFARGTRRERRMAGSTSPDYVLLNQNMQIKSCTIRRAGSKARSIHRDAQPCLRHRAPGHGNPRGKITTNARRSFKEKVESYLMPELSCERVK